MSYTRFSYTHNESADFHFPVTAVAQHIGPYKRSGDNSIYVVAQTTTARVPSPSGTRCPRVWKCPDYDSQFRLQYSSGSPEPPNTLVWEAMDSAFDGRYIHIVTTYGSYYLGATYYYRYDTLLDYYDIEPTEIHVDHGLPSVAVDENDNVVIFTEIYDTKKAYHRAWYFLSTNSGSDFSAATAVNSDPDREEGERPIMVAIDELGVIWFFLRWLFVDDFISITYDMNTSTWGSVKVVNTDASYFTNRRPLIWESDVGRTIHLAKGVSAFNLVEKCTTGSDAGWSAESTISSSPYGDLTYNNEGVYLAEDAMYTFGMYSDSNPEAWYRTKTSTGSSGGWSSQSLVFEGDDILGEGYYLHPNCDVVEGPGGVDMVGLFVARIGGYSGSAFYRWFPDHPPVSEVGGDYVQIY